MGRYGKISAGVGLLMIAAASSVIATRGRQGKAWVVGGIIFIIFGLILMSKFLIKIGGKVMNFSKTSRAPYNPTASPVSYGYPYDYGYPSPQPSYGPSSPQPSYGPPSPQPSYGY